MMRGVTKYEVSFEIILRGNISQQSEKVVLPTEKKFLDNFQVEFKGHQNPIDRFIREGEAGRKSGLN